MKNQKRNHQSRKKQTHSDMAEESIEGYTSDLESIHKNLEETKEVLKGTAQKSDLDCLVKGKELKSLVTDIVNQLLVAFEENVSKQISVKVKEETGT